MSSLDLVVLFFTTTGEGEIEFNIDVTSAALGLSFGFCDQHFSIIFLICESTPFGKSGLTPSLIITTIALLSDSSY
jgi:hypothetical protein